MILSYRWSSIFKIPEIISSQKRNFLVMSKIVPCVKWGKYLDLSSPFDKSDGDFNWQLWVLYKSPLSVLINKTRRHMWCAGPGANERVTQWTGSKVKAINKIFERHIIMKGVPFMRIMSRKWNEGEYDLKTQMWNDLAKPDFLS